MSVNGVPRAPGNTSGWPLLSVRAAARIASARAHNGTRCSRWLFIRGAGMVHTCPSLSISSHRAPRASADRAAVPFVGTYRTLCLAPEPDLERALTEIRSMTTAA